MTGDFRIRSLEVHVPYPSMVFRREVIGEVTSKVFGSLLPIQAELILLDSAVHPVDLHVKGLGEFPAHVAGEDAVEGRAVSLDRGEQLRVAHLGEGSADEDVLLVVEDNRTNFCFRGRINDSADGLTLSEYCTIRGRSWASVVSW